MIFRQLFHQETGTYTYLLASRKGGEALLIDGVLDRTERYLQLLDELDLKLVKVLDTHVHADHITAMGELRDRTKCVTVMGAKAPIDVVSMRVDDGDMVTIEGIQLEALYTPGATPSIPIATAWLTECLLAILCSSVAPGAPIFKAAIRSPPMNQFSPSS